MSVMFLRFLRLLSVVLVAFLIVLALVPDPARLLSELVLFGEDYQRHAIGFLIVSAVSAMAFKKIGLAVHWVLFVLLGAGIELAQIEMGLGRVGEWSDWYADIVGVSAGLAIHWVKRNFVGNSGKAEVIDENDGEIV